MRAEHRRNDACFPGKGVLSVRIATCYSANGSEQVVMNEQESEQNGKASVDGENERLQTLFKKWDQQPTGQPLEELLQTDNVHEAQQDRTRSVSFDAFHLWGTMTFLLVALSAWMLWMTRTELAYWLQRGSPPMDAGSLVNKWKAGQHELGLPSNVFVHASGLFSTLESEGRAPSDATEEQSDPDMYRFFLCPLYNIVVRTRQPFTPKPEREAWNLELDAELVPLIVGKRAFPSDLANEVKVTGRLLRATDAPYWYRKPLLYFARRGRLDPQSLWLFLDGESPSTYGIYVTLWGLGWLTILMSLGLYSRQYWRRRRARKMSGESS
jgi:hypothetical protein